MTARWRLGTRNPFTVYRVADGAHDVDHAREHFVCAFRREEDARLAVDAVNAQPATDEDERAERELTDALHIVRTAQSELLAANPKDAGADELDQAARLLIRWRPSAVKARRRAQPTTPPSCDCPDTDGAVHDGDTRQSADSDMESAQGELNEARLWLARRGVDVKAHRSLTWALNEAERAGVVVRPATDPAGSAVGQRGAPTPRPDRGEVARIIEDAWASNYESAMHGGGTASPEDLAWEAAGDILDLLPTPGGPRRDCENCDGRGCMDCVSRTMHDQCRDDCPTCCAPRDGGLAGVAPFDLARLATALGVSLDPDDPDPVGRLVEAAGKAREVEVVSGAEAAKLPMQSLAVWCAPDGTPNKDEDPFLTYLISPSEHDLRARVLYRAPAPAPAAVAVGEVVESAADLDRRASVGTIVEDASGDIDKRGPGGWRYTELAYPVTVVRVGGES